MKGLLAALPFFSSKGTASKVDENRSSSSVYELDANGQSGVAKYVSNMPVTTGVDKYLGKQVAKVPVNTGPTGVEKYLDGRPQKSGVAKYLEDNETAGVSGVTKYMRGMDTAPASGVAKYVANQMVLAKTTSKSSSVEKYLRKQSLSEKEVVEPSSVEQYMANKGPETIASTVEKYINKKVSATRVKFDVTGVEKYQLEQDIAEKKKKANAIVERYLEEQAIMLKETAEAEAEALNIAEREARLAESLAGVGIRK